MLVGALRPVLLVPPRLEQDPGLLLMLRHELIHALHRDLAWKGLLLAVRALHWYHPAVWLLCREAEQDMEYACDEAVLRGSGPAVRAAYGGALLSVASAGAHAPALATPFSAGGRAMKRRLEALFRQGGKRRGDALFACALLLTGIFGGLVGCGIAGETPALASPMPSVPAQTEADLSLSFHASTEQGIFQTVYSLEKPYLEDCQLIYTDFTTGATKPLCPDPDCDHCGPDCASFFYAQIGNFHMGIISDQLVLVYNVHLPQDPALLSSGEFFPPTIRVETMALDGSGRRVLATLRRWRRSRKRDTSRRTSLTSFRTALFSICSQLLRSAIQIGPMRCFGLIFPTARQRCCRGSPPSVQGPIRVICSLGALMWQPASCALTPCR